MQNYFNMKSIIAGGQESIFSEKIPKLAVVDTLNWKQRSWSANKKQNMWIPHY